MISEMLRIVGFHLPPYDCRERCAAAKVFQVEKKTFYVLYLHMAFKLFIVCFLLTLAVKTGIPVI